MRISLCLITKNEETTMERCIESVKNIVDEILVIDTGSQDKTIEIAKNIGAKIYKFEWIDDFSAARNYAISKAKGNWIIFLDGDEYIDKEQVHLLKKHIQNANKMGMNTLLTGLVNINHTDGHFQSSTTTIKIFKNTNFIKYIGKIHESLISAKGKLKCFDVSDSITIFHTGYTPEVVKGKNKSERNLRILYQELSSNPNNADIHFYIAESLMINGQYSESIDHLELAIGLNNGVINGLVHRCYSNILTCMYEEKRDISQFYKVYNRAIKIDNNYPDFDYFLGLRELDLKEYSKSIEFLNKCLDKIEKYNYNFESRVLTQVFNIYRTLINLNIILKNNNEVVRLAVKILKADKYDYNTLFILTDILIKYERVENVFNFLLKLYNKELLKDKLFLIKVAESILLNNKLDLGVTESTKEKFLYDKVFNLLSDYEYNLCFMNNSINKDLKKVIIVGVSNISLKIESLIDSEKAKIIAFVSNDNDLVGIHINGIPVIHSDKVRDQDFDCLVNIDESINLDTNKNKSIINLSNYFLNHYDFEIHRSFTKFLESDKNFEVLITGLSYLEVGVNIELLNHKTINFANSSQDLYYDFEIAQFLLQFKEFKNNVKYAIVGLSYYSFEYDLSLSNLKNRVLMYYPFINKVHNNYDNKEVLEKYNAFRRDVSTIFRHDFRTNIFNAVKEFSEDNWERLINGQLTDDKIKSGNELVAKDCNKNYPKTVRENIKIIRQYIELLQLNDIKPILVVCPTSKYYHQNFSKRIKEEFKDITTSLINDYDVKLLDYFESPSFVNEDFYDVSHLNYKGSKKFTKLLNEDILRISET